jgi:uncharacterized protein YdeI (YjbR/CyaY-like superfamily)
MHDETMSGESRNGQPVLAFVDDTAWEAWLAGNVESAGVWVKIAKKASGLASVAYPEVLDTALCFGWIDGQRVPYDATWFLQRFCPRGPRSAWSQVNVGKAEALIAEGRMRPPGLAAVEAARADGRWGRAYAPQSRAEVPDDLQAALDACPAAARFFEVLDSRNRFAILFRIQDAKRPETKARRVADFVAMLARGEKIYP